MNCAKALLLLLAVATTTSADNHPVSLANTCEESISVGVPVGDGSNAAWTVGSGVNNGEFTLLKFAGVEVGIRAMQRYVGLLTPTDTNNDSIGEYRVETGSSDDAAPSTAPPGSWWSFEWHVDVSNAEDAGKQTLAAYGGGLDLTVECVAGQCGTFGTSSYDYTTDGVYTTPLVPSIWAFASATSKASSGTLYQSSQNPFFTFWLWNDGITEAIPADDFGQGYPPEDIAAIPGDDTYDRDAEATYKLCLILDTFCPVCMLVQAALASSAPSGVPSQVPSSSGAPSGVPSKAPSLNPSGVPSILPTLSGKPSLVSCCRGNLEVFVPF